MARLGKSFGVEGGGRDGGGQEMLSGQGIP